MLPKIVLTFLFIIIHNIVHNPFMQYLVLNQCIIRAVNEENLEVHFSNF